MAERVILITGAAGDLGGDLALQFAADGWTVCGVDRRDPRDEVAQKLTFAQCDLTNAEETERVLDELQGRVGVADVVVNCAGLIANAPLVSFVDGKLTHHDCSLWDRVIASNLSSAFYVTAAVVPKMVGEGKRGVIVNVSSVCARGNAGQAAYSAAKAGVNSMTVALAKELGPLGIRVAAIAPGYFDTPSTRQNVPEQKLKEIRSGVPLKRLGKPREVFEAVRFIVDNGYFNGKILEVDGGLVV